MPSEYAWDHAQHAPAHAYLAPAIHRWLSEHRYSTILDLGCGNGAMTRTFAQAGARVVGVDASRSAIEQARTRPGGVDYRPHALDEPLPSDLRGRFDVVVAAEVIEHMFFPRHLFERAREALSPAGEMIVTTPYHGYWKNLALAVLDRFDGHWNPLLDHGHIKFFSPTTLTALAREQGFRPLELRRVGRIAPLACSMAMRLGLDGRPPS